jgi:hypothetical protein
VATNSETVIGTTILIGRNCVETIPSTITLKLIVAKPELMPKKPERRLSARLTTKRSLGGGLFIRKLLYAPAPPATIASVIADEVNSNATSTKIFKIHLPAPERSSLS